MEMKEEEKKAMETKRKEAETEMQKLEKGEEVKRLPCGHVFHAVCIDPWLKEQRAVCPVCRQGIYDDEELVGVGGKSDAQNWNMEEKFRDTDRFVFRWGERREPG